MFHCCRWFSVLLQGRCVCCRIWMVSVPRGGLGGGSEKRIQCLRCILVRNVGMRCWKSWVVKGQWGSDSLTCWSRVEARSGHCRHTSCTWFWSARSVLAWISSEKFVGAAWSSEGWGRSAAPELWDVQLLLKCSWEGRSAFAAAFSADVLLTLKSSWFVLSSWPRPVLCFAGW